MRSFIFSLLSTLIIFSGIHCESQPKALAAARASDTITVQKPLKKDTLLISAVGDIMLGSAFPSVENLPANDAKNSFNAVKNWLQEADLTFGNLEGVLLDNGNSDKCRYLNTCYAFRMPERYIDVIKNAGFDVMSVANNHSGDFADRGRKRTSEKLDSAQLYYAGFITQPSTIFKKDGITYGFCAFAPNSGTVSINDLAGAAKIIASLRKKVDIVIVSFHGGGEGANFQNVPRKNELFYGENRGNVYKFAHTAIDAGADVVLGHGPHVSRAVEHYKNRFIAYSLGNFATYGMFSLKGPNGIAPLLQLKISNKGEFLAAKIISIKQTKNNHPVVDSSQDAFIKIKELTQADFPETALRFEENGEIYPN